MGEQIQMRQIGEVLIDWLFAALTDTSPAELPDGTDFSSVYRFSVYHGVAGLAFYSVAKLKRKPDPDLYAKWQRQCLTNAAKTENQVRERDRIIDCLTGAGIDLLPMKGCRLIELYPRRDYRMMSDLDMLVLPKDAGRVRELMVELGYTVEKFGNYHDDNYRLPPYVSVEIHKHVGEEVGRDSSDLERAIFGYSEGIWDRALPVEGRPHLYRLDDTEFYIEMILHFAKHALISGGSGIRSVMDFYIYREKCKGSLDRARIDSVMEQMGLTDFLRLTETLADLWFGRRDTADETEKRKNAALWQEEGELSDFARAILEAGLFGDREHKNRMRLTVEMERGGSRKSANRRFFLFRAFPPLRIMKIRYRILWKLPILLPFFWIIRLVDALLFRRRAIRQDLDSMKEVEK